MFIWGLSSEGALRVTGFPKSGAVLWVHSSFHGMNPPSHKLTPVSLFPNDKKQGLGGEGGMGMGGWSLSINEQRSPGVMEN